MGRWIEDPRELPSGWRWDPNAPDDNPAETDALGGHLGTVTDLEWRAAHERLIAEMPELADQLTYTWDPALDGRTLIGAGEYDIAHRDGRYDPARDERFTGGGFRG